MADDFVYQGNELELFALATNWKAYWSSKVRPYLGSRVLDVGAGVGGNMHYLCGAEQTIWVGLEPDADLVAQMRREKAEGKLPQILDVRPGTIKDVPAEPSFDTILYIDVLEHIQDAKQELLWAAERLRGGGFLVVLAPAHQLLFTPFDKAIGHFRRYSRESLVSLTPAEAGLIKIMYLDSVGLLASLGNRFLLNSSMPTRRQIKVWDNTMVRSSRLVDRFIRYSLGKSVLAVWKKEI